MTQYIYVESATGRAVSQTSDPDILSRIKPGYEVIQVTDEDINGIWKAESKSFEPRPERRIIDKLDFLELFTDAELEEIILHPHAKVKVFIKKLELAGRVDLKSVRMIKAIDGMQALGILTSERSEAIKNG